MRCACWSLCRERLERLLRESQWFVKLRWKLEKGREKKRKRYFDAHTHTHTCTITNTRRKRNETYIGLGVFIIF